MGLTLAEGKAILKGLQEVVVQQQMTAYLETQRPCAHCGHRQRNKGYHTTQVMAYNFAKRFKTLRGLTPYEYICQCWHKEPDRFTINPYHHTLGLNI